MNKLLALGGLIAMMTACSGLSNTAGGHPSGNTVAAILGYHGPAERSGVFDSN